MANEGRVPSGLRQRIQRTSRAAVVRDAVTCVRRTQGQQRAVFLLTAEAPDQTLQTGAARAVQRLNRVAARVLDIELGAALDRRVLRQPVVDLGAVLRRLRVVDL